MLKNGKQRYYVHGDEKMEDSSKYYCARCDLFVDVGHFYTEHKNAKDSDYERYRWALGVWNRLKKTDSGGKQFYRPSNPPNYHA